MVSIGIQSYETWQKLVGELNDCDQPDDLLTDYKSQPALNIKLVFWKIQTDHVKLTPVFDSENFCYQIMMVICIDALLIRVKFCFEIVAV